MICFTFTTGSQTGYSASDVAETTWDRFKIGTGRVPFTSANRPILTANRV